jgi:hypothetical protein
MAHFTTAAKRYREGTPFDSFGGLDVGVYPGPTPTTVDQWAPKSLPDDGGPERMFLFWDTGRCITGKRHVRWTFSHADQWTTWNAVAWYGIPPANGGGGHTISLDAFWVTNGTLDPTPVDPPPASTFVDGAGAGNTAWPAGGNDHLVNTQWGSGNIHALSHLRRSVADPELDFSSIEQLTWGGDDSSTFEENDDGVTSTTGITGIASSTSQDFPFAQGAGAVLMIGYVQPVSTVPPFGWKLKELVDEAILQHFINPVVDPSPEDMVRLKLISESLDLVRGERPGPDVFEGLVSAAKGMSASELKRTIASTKATLNRGESALKSLEAMAKKATR